MVTWSARAVPNRSRKEDSGTGEQGCHDEVKKKSRRSKQKPVQKRASRARWSAIGRLACNARGDAKAQRRKKYQRAELDEPE
jgi:hypothetical protein